MKDIFKDILGMDGVHGVLVVSTEGNVVTSKFSSKFQHEEDNLRQINWASFVIELSGIADAELIYDNAKLYVKNSEAGYLIVILEDYTQISMVRLNCEVLLPSLYRMKPAGKRIGEILRKKIF